VLQEAEEGTEHKQEQQNPGLTSDEGNICGIVKIALVINQIPQRTIGHRTG
jgi:hypothetical protein